MRKILLAVIVIVALVVGVVFAINKNDNIVPQSEGNSGQNNPSPSNSNAATGNVDITKDMIFTPSQITVKRGATVTWTNNDDTGHTVTNDLEGKGPDSETIPPGKTYSYTFTESGSYQYHCKIHPSMRGTIVVQ